MAEMTGVETESFSEEISERGNRLAVLCRENHIPSPMASLSSIAWIREPGRMMAPRTSTLELESLIETFRAPTQNKFSFKLFYAEIIIPLVLS